MTHTSVAAAIRSLYSELHEAMTTIDIKDGLNFRYDSVEVELAMEMGQTTEAGAGVKFWVVEGSGKKGAERRATHTLRINITPVVSEESQLHSPWHSFAVTCASPASPSISGGGVVARARMARGLTDDSS
ncbi:trypco2 family protein [Streptomyces sp. T028]|uniref:trypco2 family protein n=1 Tax=Streptomyces sp. T028 TaxID=3394379 RepID=UPI003A8AC5D5